MSSHRTASAGLLVVLTVAAFAAPEIARAEPAEMAGRWTIAGKSADGADYAATLKLDGERRSLSVRLELDHPEHGGVWLGKGIQDHGQLWFSVRPEHEAARGARGALAGETVEATGARIEGIFRGSSSQLEGETVLIDAAEQRHPIGAETATRPVDAEAIDVDSSESPDAAPADAAADAAVDDDVGAIREVGRHLLALAKTELREEAVDGVDLEHRFRVSDYFHIGASTGVRLIDAPDADQRLTDAREGDRGFWAATSVAGGPRVPLTTIIPLGEATISAGFTTGARLTYEVTDRYRIPDGVAGPDGALEQLRTASSRTFDLPLTAADALAMNVGAKRVMEGEGTVALNGSISIGTDLTDLGGDVARIGASARVGGFYRIRGHVRLKVVRLDGTEVAVRFTRGRSRTRGGSADLFLGLFVDRNVLADEIAPEIEYIDILTDEIADEIADQVEDVVRFRLAFGGEASRRSQFDITYRFDLSDPAAAAAYERAIRGDLRAADEATAAPSVTEELRILLDEERFHRFANLDVSVIRASRSRTATATDVSVEEELRGASRFQIFRYERHGRSLVGSDQRLLLEVVHARTPEHDAAGLPPEARERALRFRWSIDDAFSTSGDVRRFIDWIDRVDLPGGAEATARVRESWPDRNIFQRIGGGRFGRTTREIGIDVTEEGLKRILEVDDGATLLQAYAAAFARIEGDIPLWASAEGREVVDDWDRFGDSSVQNDPDLDRAVTELRRARGFVKDVRRLVEVDEHDDDARAERLTELADGMGFRLHGIAALAALAPRDTLRTRVGLSGEHVAGGGFTAGFTGERFRPLEVRIPEGR